MREIMGTATRTKSYCIRQIYKLTLPGAINPGARPSSFVTVVPTCNHSLFSSCHSSFTGSPFAGFPVVVLRAWEVIGERIVACVEAIVVDCTAGSLEVILEAER